MTKAPRSKVRTLPDIDVDDPTTWPARMGAGTAAQILGVTTKTIQRWHDDGTLPSSAPTPGKHRRFNARDVRQLQLARAESTTP